MCIGKRKGRDKEGKWKRKGVLCSLPLPNPSPESRYAEGAGMLTKDEAERIASAGNAYRPDWSIPQLMGVIADERIRLKRTYRDTAIAMTAIAVDPTTRQPTRLLESGPWWEATRPANPNSSAVLEHVDFTEACTVCLKDREHLWHGATGTVNDHDWTPPQPAVRAPLSLRERIQRMTDEREPV